MFRKKLSVILSVSVIASCYVISSGADSPFCPTAYAKETSAANYSYAITPVLEPFNEYFYVKTDNPDPMSFRFVDNSTVYGEKGACGYLDLLYDSWNEEAVIFSDVVYENKSTARVTGGYIFQGNDTDGGYVTLQYKKDISYSEYEKINQTEGNANIGEYTETTSSSKSGGFSTKTYYITGYYKWENTSIKIKLPKLVSSVDYLVNTYAKKDNFFDNMDAVQSGLNSICLYSGSYIKGEVYRANKYWFLSTSPHVDQNFYIQNPYSRKGNKPLFASYLYPYKWDSFSFPNAMGIVANILEPSATYKSNNDYHWLIDVTYNGKTRSFGGAGNGKGVGITENQIIKKFNFKNGVEKMDLAGAKDLLDRYSKLEEIDDYPHYDDLTWKQVADKVGENGAWVRLLVIYSIFGSSETGYTYLYKNPGYDDYPGHVSDTWVDGRYINRWEYWEKGAEFKDYPTSNIMLTSITAPYISYDYTFKYNYDIENYEKVYSNITISEKKAKNILFSYSSNDKVWKAEYAPDTKGYANYNDVEEMVKKGLIDKKYLDMLTLTQDEVKALKVDKNTNTAPPNNYIYDGTTKPGTVYVPVSSIKLSKTSATIEKGKTLSLTAAVSPTNATYKTFTWTTSNSKVATVSDGRITAVSVGTATITAKSENGKTAVCKITVKKPDIAVSSIKLSKSVLTLGKGETFSLRATVSPSNATNKTVVWRTSNSKILTVDKNGNVKAVGNGTAWITARTTNGLEKSCKITVKNAPTKITLTKGILTIGVGEKYTIGAGINDGAGCAKRTYRTSNSSIVKMTRTDWNGDFYGVKPGVAYVTVRTYNGKESTCKVTVKAAPASVAISRKNLTMKVGATATLSCSVPSNAGCALRTFRSSNSNVVKMTKTNWTGSFKAVAPGTAYVTVRTYNGKESTCKITVVR